MSEGDLGTLRQQLIASFDEDVVQDTLLALLRQSEEPRVPLHWCRAVARKIRLRRLRDLGRRATVALPPSLSTSPPQMRLLLAKEALSDANLDLLRDGFGAPGRLARQRRSEHRIKLRLAHGDV